MKLIELEEFVEHGYLQELNRQFLHPLGLALLVGEGRHGKMFSFGAMDAREGDAGMTFTQDEWAPDAEEKMKRVTSEQAAKMKRRMETLGFAIQPVGTHVQVEADQKKG